MLQTWTVTPRSKTPPLELVIGTLGVHTTVTCQMAWRQAVVSKFNLSFLCFIIICDCNIFMKFLQHYVAKIYNACSYIWVFIIQKNIGQCVYEGICSGSRSCHFLRGAHSFQKRNILSYGSHDFKFRAFIKISINSNYYYYHIRNIYCCVLCHLTEKFILT
jgi:hypothetical protein